MKKLILDRLVAYNYGGRYDVAAYSRVSSPCSKIIEIQDAKASYDNIMGTWYTHIHHLI